MLMQYMCSFAEISMPFSVLYSAQGILLKAVPDIHCWTICAQILMIREGGITYTRKGQADVIARNKGTHLGCA